MVHNKLRNTNVQFLQMEASGGSMVHSAIEDGIKVAFDLGLDVVVTHNGTDFRISPSEIVSFICLNEKES